MGKRLQLLKEVAPGMTRVAVLWQPDHYGEGTVKIMSEATEAAARALAVRLQRVEARSADDLAGAFGAMTEGRPMLSSYGRARCSFLNESAS
jgi:putative ABC transport system substrate-binding protein